MAWGSEKTKKRALERARALLRQAGELAPPKRARTDAGWSTSTWRSSDSSWKNEEHWADAPAESSSSSSSWKDDKHWSDTPAEPVSRTVQPPPPPAREKAAPEVKDEPKLDDELDEPAAEYEVYSFGRKDPAFTPPAVDILLDCEVLRSASSDRESWACCGLNGAIIFEISGHARLPELILKAVREIRRLRDEGVKPIRIGARCYAGRHRSVAVVTLISEALELMGIDGTPSVVSYAHLGEPDRPFCGCPTDCVNIEPDSKHWAKVSKDHPAWDPVSLRLHWQQNGEAGLFHFRRLWATAIKREADILL